MEAVLAVAKAMSDPNRLRVLCVLQGRERCACEIIEMLGLAQATVSRHMSILVQAGMVVGRKEGRWVHYRLPGRKDAAPAVVKDALKWVQRYAGCSEQAVVDADVLCPSASGSCA